MKKNTLRKKQLQNPKGPKGKSRYAVKVDRRRKLAKKLGCPGATFPLINSGETE